MLRFTSLGFLWAWLRVSLPCGFFEFGLPHFFFMALGLAKGLSCLGVHGFGLRFHWFGNSFGLRMFVEQECLLQSCKDTFVGKDLFPCLLACLPACSFFPFLLSFLPPFLPARINTNIQNKCPPHQQP